MATPVAPAVVSRSETRRVLSKQIAGLDGLRLIAAGMVMAFHLLFAIWIPGANRRVPPTLLFHPVQSFVTFGWVGVEVFFVISGFVIAYSAHGVRAVTFARHRWLRLFPAALLCASVSAVALFYLDEMPKRSVLFAWGRSILFYPKGSYVDGAYWTLSIEIAFYAIVFFLLLVRRERWLPIVMAMLGGISTSYWLLDCVAQKLTPGLHRLYVILHAIASWNISLVPHGCYFALGVYLWLLCLGRVSVARICVAAVCFVGGVIQIAQRTKLMQSVMNAPQSRIAPVAIWSLAVALVILSVLYNDAVHSILGVRGVAIARRLGLMTYPLYLLNQTLGRALVLALFAGIGYLAATVISSVVIFAITSLIAEFLEPPLRRWLGMHMDRLNGKAVSALAAQSIP